MPNTWANIASKQVKDRQISQLVEGNSQALFTVAQFTRKYYFLGFTKSSKWRRFEEACM